MRYALCAAMRYCGVEKRDGLWRNPLLVENRNEVYAVADVT